jgi:hypothetical protein
MPSSRRNGRSPSVAPNFSFFFAATCNNKHYHDVFAQSETNSKTLFGKKAS